MKIAADRRGVRPRALTRSAQHASEPAVGAVGDNEVSGPHLRGRAVRLSDDDAADESSFDDRRDRLVAVEERGPRYNHTIGDELVEPVAAGDETVRRKHGMRRPADLDVAATSGQPDPIDPLESRQCVVIDTHRRELVDRARGVSMSPHVFMRGNVRRSRTVT